MSTNTALELSPEELEIIEARRSEEQRKEDERTAGLKRDWDKHVRQTEADNLAKRNLIADLQFNDIDGIFKITDSTETSESGNGFGSVDIYKPRITFVLNGRDEDLRIEEHHVSSRHSWRGRNNGYKFHLYGGFNDYKDRWYKRASTLVTRVKEMQDAIVSKKRYDRELAQEIADKKQEALDLATKTYPNARIEVAEKNNVVYIKRDDVGTLTLNYVRDYETKVMTLVYNSVKLADELHTEILAKFEA